MADNNENWFGSWFNAARIKSSEVLEFVKKDLGEFGSVVKNEATNVVSSTGNVIEKTLGLNEPESTASSVKRSISTFIGQMNEALNPSPDDPDTEAIMIVEGEMVKLSKLQQLLYELQKNEETYLTDPESSLHKQYECWLDIIDDQLSEERVQKHLASSATLNDQYVKLVPTSVSHVLFWKRYLFKKALLEDEVARQEALERREAKEKQMSEDSLKWDQEDFALDLELTEEEQIRLLEQYEKETKLKEEQKKKKELDNEELLSQQPPTRTKPLKENSTSQPERVVEEENEAKVDKTINEKTNKNLSNLKLTENESSASLGTNSSSRSSTDDDWEKINDV